MAKKRIHKWMDKIEEIRNKYEGLMHYSLYQLFHAIRSVPCEVKGWDDIKEKDKEELLYLLSRLADYGQL